MRTGGSTSGLAMAPRWQEGETEALVSASTGTAWLPSGCFPFGMTKTGLCAGSGGFARRARSAWMHLRMLIGSYTTGWEAQIWVLTFALADCFDSILFALWSTCFGSVSP